MTGGIGGGQSVASLVGATPQIPWFVGATIFLVCLLVASFLAYCDLFTLIKSSEGTKLTLTKPKGRHLNSSHRITLWEIEQQMESLHGHSDHEGLEADIRDGVLVGDLMGRNCTRCNKPRNQRGDLVL